MHESSDEVLMELLDDDTNSHRLFYNFIQLFNMLLLLICL